MQQFITNVNELQSVIDEANETPTPDMNKLFGLCWDRSNDNLLTKPILLDDKADTKRKILSTITSPLLNRSRLFVHQLQCQNDLGWDEILTLTQVNEWKNIAIQANKAPPIPVQCCFGERHHRFRIVAFADSSKQIFGTAVYLCNIDTSKLSFVLARNKLVNKTVATKSIPSLELLAIHLAVETVADLKNELLGPIVFILLKLKAVKSILTASLLLHGLGPMLYSCQK